MPDSMAASTTAFVFASSRRIPKLLHPSPTSDTSRLPIFRVSIAAIPRSLRGLEISAAGDELLASALDRARPAPPVRPRPVGGGRQTGGGADQEAGARAEPIAGGAQDRTADGRAAEEHHR